MKYKKSLFLIILFLSVLNSKAQETYLFVGKALDSETLDPIQYTHVINLKNSKGGLTNNNGYFFQKVVLGDYLKLSFMGYNTLYFQVQNNNSDTLTFLLVRKVFELKNVDVYPWTRREFRYKFVYKDFNSDSIDWLLNIIKVSKAELLAIHNNKPYIAIPIFSNFKTKKEKQIIRLEALKKWLKHDKRYRVMLVKVTGYKDLELNQFIRYCNFSKRYISYARSYYLSSAIEKKHIEFEKNKLLLIQKKAQ